MATALDVIAEQGVAGASTAPIARAADVPLGSTTLPLSPRSTSCSPRQSPGTRTTWPPASRSRCAPRATARPRSSSSSSTSPRPCSAPERDLVLSVELYVAAARRARAARRHPGLDAAEPARAGDPLRPGDRAGARRADRRPRAASALSTDPMAAEQIRHAIRRFTRWSSGGASAPVTSARRGRARTPTRTSRSSAAST